MPLSGNCYKAAWILHRLGIPYEMIRTTFVDGGTRSDDFLKRIPTAKYRCWSWMTVVE